MDDRLCRAETSLGSHLSGSLVVDLHSLALMPTQRTELGNQIVNGQIAASIRTIIYMRRNSPLTGHPEIHIALQNALYLYVEALVQSEFSRSPGCLIWLRSCDRQLLWLMAELEKNPTLEKITSAMIFLVCAVYSLRRLLNLPLPRNSEWELRCPIAFEPRHSTLPGWRFNSTPKVIPFLKFQTTNDGLIIESPTDEVIATFQLESSKVITFPAILSDHLPPWGISELLEAQEAQRIVSDVLNELESVWQDGYLTICQSVQFVGGLRRQSDHHWRSSSDSGVPGFVFAVLDEFCRLQTAEGLLHEAMHQRMYLIERIVKLTKNDTPKYRHAWRPDNRPIRGVLLAVHAFYAVEQLYAAYLAYGIADERRVAREHRRIQAGVSEGLACLSASDDLTEIGMEITSTIREDRYRRSW